MAALIEVVRPLLTMMLVIAVMLWIIKGSRPRRLGKYGQFRALRRYDTGRHLLGPLMVTLFIPVRFFAGVDLFIACAGAGVLVAAANRFGLLWRATLWVVAALGALIQAHTVWDFLVGTLEDGVLEMVYALSFLLLVCACFLLGALLSLVWDRHVTVKALSFLVVLDLVMLLAEPAFAVSIISPLLATVVWALVACGTTGLLGLFSFPITLDLLAVGLALAVFSTTAGHDLGPVLVGTGFGLVTREAVRRYTGA